MWEDYFSVQIFFIILRETLESAIIVSVLLSFIKQNFTTVDPVTGHSQLNVDLVTYRSLKMQVWVGALAGLAICMGLGAVFIAVFYLIGNDLWSFAERIWEGLFSILSAVIISFMGLALLRINSLQHKWKWKLSNSLNSQHEQALLEHVHDDPMAEDLTRYVSLKIKIDRYLKKYALAVLPFITTLREGLEAVVFVGGIGVNQPATSFPLAIIFGGLVGVAVGLTLYKGGNKMSLQYFLIMSTCFLYMVAAGLISRGVWFLELEKFVQRCGQDTSESGSGPGSYDIAYSVWHVNCCNGLTDGGWMLFNALVGWTNSATYGSVISYILYWIFIIVLLKVKSQRETVGYLPYIPIRYQLHSIKKRIAFDRILLDDIINDYNELQSNASIHDLDNSGEELGISNSDEATTLLGSRS
ncbi:hypothetical protein CANARDRAFT_26031 [[Candida] arabinofermentans NRRL YB-2248]|uniref:Iron permease FTR1 n=1 Tax=[Candida] arabinofermentans NRRL YB-2248 TaxID=983967 RepID=A0A1E4T7U2_9ASCO|nr:hypothetical protein CANARDRAFT_26031 [[Candida] arabinofermentans NRRL YB-2248]